MSEVIFSSVGEMLQTQCGGVINQANAAEGRRSGRPNCGIRCQMYDNGKQILLPTT